MHHLFNAIITLDSITHLFYWNYRKSVHINEWKCLSHLVGAFSIRSVENVTLSLITFIEFHFHIDSNRIFSVKWFSFTRFFCCFHLRVNGNKSGIFSQISINILNSYSVCRRLKVENSLKFVFFLNFIPFFLLAFSSIKRVFFSIKPSDLCDLFVFSAQN